MGIVVETVNFSDANANLNSADIKYVINKTGRWPINNIMVVRYQ